jgi:hypothetical protein
MVLQLAGVINPSVNHESVSKSERKCWAMELNFWRLEQFYTNSMKQGCCRHLFQAIDFFKTNKGTTMKQQK